MIQNKWFDSDGRNFSGYEQVYARLDYVKKERETMTEEEIKYEIDIVKRLISLMFTKESKKIYTIKLEEVLNEVQF